MSWIEHISPELNMIGAGSCENELTQPFSNTPDNLLLLVNIGEGVLSFNGQTIALNEGDWVIIPPSTKFKIDKITETFWVQWLNFNWIKATLVDKTSKSIIPNEIKMGNIGESGQCNLLWDIIWNRWHSNDICEIKTCNALLLEILIRLFSEQEFKDAQEHDNQENHGIPEDQLAILMKRILDEMPPNQKSIQEVLAGMNFSHEYMNRVFMDNFGISPLEYLTKLRVEQAAKKTPSSDDDGSGLVRVEYEGGYYAYEHKPQFRRHFDFSGYDQY